MAGHSEFIKAQRKMLDEEGTLDEAAKTAELERRSHLRLAVTKDIGAVSAHVNSLKHFMEGHDKAYLMQREAHLADPGSLSSYAETCRSLMRIPYDGIDAALTKLSAHLPPMTGTGEWASELVAQVLQASDEATAYQRQVKEQCPELFVESLANEAPEEKAAEAMASEAPTASKAEAETAAGGSSCCSIM